MTQHRGTDIRQELAKSLAQIRSQIQTVEHDAQRIGISPHDMKDALGNYVLSPLLVAKAQVLHALVLMNQAAIPANV